MPTVLVVYFSKTGNTEEMAKAVEEGLRSEAVDVVRKKVSRALPKDLVGADGVILGSPTYYGNMSSEMKAFLDRTVSLHGKLDGKVGGAFACGGVLGGGVEATAMALTQALLIHGMIVQGDPWGSHYGTVSIGKPTVAVKRECRKLGERVARLLKRLAPAS